MYVVYKHTTPSGKVYIGITKRKPEYRWNHGNGYKNNEHFYRAILKYGWDNIKHEIVENGLTKKQACDLEIKLIAKYDAANPRKGYNNSTGGEYSAVGVHPSAETRRKIGEANKGANNPWYGKHLSADMRLKIGESLKGANNPNYGKHPSADTRLKLSESHKGHNHSSETRQKMSESHKGKNAKAVICVETGTLYSSVTEAAESIGVTRMAISRVLRGITKTSGGYHWEFTDGSKHDYGRRLSAESLRKIREASAIAVICIETGILYNSITEAAKSTGVTRTAITHVLHGKARLAAVITGGMLMIGDEYEE